VQSLNKVANLFQSPVLGIRINASFDVRLQLGRMLHCLESRIHKMRMALRNEQNCNVQTCISGNGDYLRESSSLQTSHLSLSQIQNTYGDDPRPANRVALGVKEPETDSYNTILGVEIVNGQERIIWGKAPDLPWA
jgi:hypothetical protein